MKDFYKILGVKERATEEEIRERWIGLMRKYHPDQTGEKASDDQRPKEINEAYEVLKFSSSRVKYDLERAYERRKRRRGLGRSLLRRSSLLLIPLVLGLIYLSIEGFLSPPWQKEGEPPLSKKKPVKASQQFSQEEENVRFKNRRPYLLAPFVGVGEANSQEDRNGSRRAAKDTPPLKKQSMKEAPREAREDIPPQAERVRPLIPLEQPVTPPGRESRSMVSRQDPGSAPARQPGDPAADPNTRKPADGRVAMEEEVDRFFENYVSHYTQRDIAGFLNFFSSGAVQNRKEGLNGIRKIYGEFFDQSQSLIYHLKNPKIEIFPSHILVKASYEINQVLKTGDTRLWKGNIEWGLIREGGELKISSIQYEHDRSP